MFFLSVSSAGYFGQNLDKIIVVDNVGRSILRIFTDCEYKLVLKNPKDKEVKINIVMIGNGFFAGEHGNRDIVVTADHLFLCRETVGELAANGVLSEIDRSNGEDLTPENIVAIKDGKIDNISGFNYEGGNVIDIKILFNTPPAKTITDPDRALLEVIVPDDVSHMHLPLMNDKDFDATFYKETIIGQEVVVRGYLLFGNGWFLRYRNALIEWIRPEIFQINEVLDHGLSGGPVIFLNNGKIYAIGVVSFGPQQEKARIFDMSWVTIVKKSFLDKRNKK